MTTTPTDIVEFSYHGGGHARPLHFTLRGPAGDHIINCVRHKATFYEVDLLEAVGLLVARGQWAIDVGANIGNHSLFFARVLDCSVISIEPFPVASGLLRHNIAINKIEHRVRIIDAAASCAAGTLILEAPSHNIGMAHVVDSGPAESGLPVRCDRLDRLLEECALDRKAVIGLIKIDVEGHEHAAISGALETIKKHRPVLIVEIAGAQEVSRIDAMLSPIGYTRFGPWCATPTWIYSVRRYRHRALLLRNRASRRLRRWLRLDGQR